MLFEWDEAKSLRTLKERGFGFDYAARMFLEHDPEKWAPIFGKDHAPAIR